MTTITIERATLDRLIDAWDSTVLPKSRDGMMQERMEDLRAALAAPATAPSAKAKKPRLNSAAFMTALVAENERLRRDAERYRWLAKYLVSDDESHDDAIVAATTVAELDYVIDAAMKGTP